MFFRLFPVKKNKVCLVSPHNSGFNDSLKFVKDELEKRGKYNFIYVSTSDIKSLKNIFSFFVINAYHAATSRFVFLNDNFMPFAHVYFSNKTTVVQLWHGQGAFKKFGLSCNLPESERKLAERCAQRYNYIAVSSKNVSYLYMQAFNADKKQIIVSGIPDSDFFYSMENKNIFRNKYKIPESKKIVLYAPTFRDNIEDNRKIFDNFSCSRFIDALSEDYVLVVRLHPQVHFECNLKNVIDATNYPNVNEIIIDSDLLITDYSSICMEFSMTDKPMIFYAYDLDDYKKRRNFYFNYEDYVPGKIVRSMNELIEAIKNNDYEKEKNDKFKNYNFSFFDGKSSFRLIDFLMKNITTDKIGENNE